MRFKVNLPVRKFLFQYQMADLDKIGGLPVSALVFIHQNTYCALELKENSRSSSFSYYISYSEMHLQEIMVPLLIKTNIQS